MLTEAQKRANIKYRKKAYEQIQVNVKNGKRDIIKEYANKNGLSINNYINIAIDERLKKDGYTQAETETENKTE